MKTKEDWLLNNPHCKQIESCSKSLSKKCICPKEEPKQETLEEVIGREFQFHSSTEIKDEKYVYLIDKRGFKIAVNNILKWQQERMYSEEEVIEILNKFSEACYWPIDKFEIPEWFEKFKNK